MPDTTSSGESPAPLSGHLREELEASERLLLAQTKTVQRFLETQGRRLADGLISRVPQVRFTLPDRLVVSVETGEQSIVPPEQREEAVGGFVDRVTRADIRVIVRQRLAELEQSPLAGVAASARLIRHATVNQMIYAMLPAGRKVQYRPAEGDSIPSIPAGDDLEPESAIMASTDAVAEESRPEEGRGDLIVPYVPSARRFFLPQWVALDENDRLLVGSVQEAEAHIRSMQRFLAVLHAAVSLAPYMVADEEYQRKRYGILGQLVNQARALARYQTRDIIRTIERRAEASSLNRGLSLSLPYFDDQDLELRTRDFEVIPAGRIMFVPAFVVRAAEDESAKVAQDTRLDPSTRRHLLDELRLLEEAFHSPQARPPARGRTE